MALLAPDGKLFGAMHSADSDSIIQFSFPLERLPTHTQLLLATEAGRCAARPCSHRSSRPRHMLRSLNVSAGSGSQLPVRSPWAALVMCCTLCIACVALAVRGACVFGVLPHLRHQLRACSAEPKRGRLWRMCTHAPAKMCISACMTCPAHGDTALALSKHCEHMHHALASQQEQQPGEPAKMFC